MHVFGIHNSSVQPSIGAGANTDYYHITLRSRPKSSIPGDEGLRSVDRGMISKCTLDALSKVALRFSALKVIAIHDDPAAEKGVPESERDVEDAVVHEERDELQQGLLCGESDASKSAWGKSLPMISLVEENNKIKCIVLFKRIHNN